MNIFVLPIKWEIGYFFILFSTRTSSKFYIDIYMINNIQWKTKKLLLSKLLNH